MRIFKYLHPDRVDVLAGRAIRFSSPAVLNDPFELKPHLAALASPDHLETELKRMLPEILREEMSKLPAELLSKLSPDALMDFVLRQFPDINKNVQAMAKQLMPMLQEKMGQTFDGRIGILCLSEVADNLLMWAHYADSHRGFLIEFDEKSPFFDRRISPVDDLRHLRKVTYSSQRPALTLADVKDFSPFMMKGLDWQYEAEWRMIMPLDAASRIIGEGANAVHLFEFPADALSSVVLGCRMSEASKAEIRQVLASSPHYGHVRCVEAEIDSEHYRLHVPLPDR